MEEIMKRITLFLAFVILGAITTLGQTGSGLTGVVTDSTNARVPGAKVTLLDTKTSRELVTESNDQGVYTFSNVPPGDGYKLTFEAPGFQKYVISNVVIGVAQTATHNGILTAGQVSETVEVVSTTGDATL